MIALIDADSILFQSLPKKRNPDATFEDCVAEMEDRIQTIVKTANCNQYILFLTYGKCFRYKNWKVSKPYKYNRKGSQFPPIFYGLKEHLIQNFNAYIYKGLEADDLVSYYSTVYPDSVICSPDKDVIYQNAGTHFDYGKMQHITVTEEDAEKFLFYQLAIGDSTDGISGIQGVGKATAEKWFDNKSPEHTYHELVLDKYIEKYDFHEGINRFFENFTMVYILKTENDLIREFGELPEDPIINEINNETTDIDNLI